MTDQKKVCAYCGGELASWAVEHVMQECAEELKRQRDALISSTGALAITRERLRQIEVKGWTAEHDSRWTHEQLAEAATFYAAPEKYGEMLAFWPWAPEWNKKRQHDRLRQLAIAGALIAAELDWLPAGSSNTICPCGGDDRTGKGSLIVDGRTFCNDDHFEEWHAAIRAKQAEIHS